MISKITYIIAFICICISSYSQCPQLNTEGSSPDCTSNCNLCIGDQITFSLTGENMNDGDEIDWFIGNDGSIPIDYIGSSSISACNDVIDVLYIMINPQTGGDRCDEFIVIQTGNTVINVNEINVTNVGGNTLMPYTTGNGVVFPDCGTVIGPGDNVPANSILIIQSSAIGTEVYDINELCGSGFPVYIIASSNTSCSGGYFVNSGTQTYTASTDCFELDVTYNGSTTPGWGWSNQNGSADYDNVVPTLDYPSLNAGANIISDYTFEITQIILDNYCSPNSTQLDIQGFLDPQSGGGCSDVETSIYNITVTCPEANTAGPLGACLVNGTANFDFTSLEATVSGGSGSVTWYSDVAGNNTIPGGFLSSSVGGSVYASISVNGCESDLQEIQFITLDEPNVDISISPTNACEGELIQLFEDGLGNVAWDWEGPGGFNSVVDDPIVDPANTGIYTVTVTDANNCTSEGTFDFVPNAGPDITWIPPNFGEVCVGDCVEVPIDITGGTGPYTVDFVGSVLGIFNHNFTFGIEDSENFITLCLTGGGILNPVSDDDANNTVTVTTLAAAVGTGTVSILGITDSNGCSGTFTSDLYTITLAEEPDTDNPSPIEACLVGGVATFDLTDIEQDINSDAGLTFSWFEDAGLTNPVTSPYSTPGPETLYVVVDNGACPADAIAITLMVGSGSDAGMDNTIEICNDDNTPVNIFDALNGTPDTGGGWTDDDASGVSIANPSMVVFEGLAPGDYDFTYSIAATADCPGASATLTVTMIEASNSGLPGGAFICEGSSTLVNLFTSLNGTPTLGGSWSDLGGSGVDLSDPTVVDFSNVGVGNYPFLYNINATPPCTDQATTVTVTIDTAPNAGTASSTQICNSGIAIISLEDELGPHDGGGNWTDLNSSGVDLSDPTNVDFSNTTGGAYQYMYTIPATGSCPEASQVVTINVIDGPNAGTNSAISLCEGDSNPIDLFGSLEGSPEAGGTWSDIDGTGVDLSDPSAVIFSGLTNNTYEFAYTIMGSGICNDAVSLLSVTIIDGANAGMGSSAFLCLNATNDDINLFVLLNGTPDTGGFWTDDDASGLDLSDPMSVDFTSLPIGGYNFTYTVAGVGLCPSSSATVAVEINTSPNPGMNSLNPICNSGSPVVNFDELLGTHDSGGTWTDDDAIGVDISDPSQVSFDGVPLGVYDFTYSIPSVGSCPEVSATINIQITPGPNAGEGSTVELCQDENLIINLEAELTGNPKTIGVWSDENNSGVDLSTPDNVDLGDLMPGVYNYVYEVTTSVNCDPDSAIVEITILGSVSPGDDASTSVCFGSTVDLENLLINNDLIGSFVDPNSTGALSGSMVNTSLLTEGESYTFIHQVSGPDNCNMTTEAELTIMVVAAVSAGENVQAQICPSQDISLVDYLDNADLGGMFLDNDNTGLLSGNIFMVPESGTFNFTYQIGDGIDCPVSFSNLVLEVIEAPVVNFSLDTEVCAGACEVLSITAASADIIEGMILIMTDENGNEEDTQIVFQQSSTFMLPICYTNDGIFSFDNLEEGTYTLSVLPIDYQGCTFDLGVSLMITAEEQSTELIDDVLCPGEFIMVNGTEYNEDNPSGMETEIEDNGCEKMITIALTFLQDTENDIIESLCNDESIMVNNVVYDQDNPIGQEIIENAAANGCDSIVNIDLSFEQEFVLETMIDCNDIESSSVSFSSAAVNSAPYSVLIDNEPAIIVNALPFVFDLSEGMHTIVITDVEGCSFVENITIDIDAIDIEIVSTMISDNMFSLTVMSNIVLDNYNWSPAEFLSCTDCPNPIATISGTQDILLNATYGSNCDVSDQISLTEIVNEIENTDIYMPTIFSPNNDGINDNFTIYTEEARLITTFQVYDRWGNRVFMSNNIETNNEEAGWDGKFKTKKLDPGVYTYFAELIFSDADRRIVKGSVTLMK